MVAAVRGMRDPGEARGPNPNAKCLQRQGVRVYGSGVRCRLLPRVATACRCAARDEVHLRSGPGEPGAEIASDAARPVDSYARHSRIPSVPGPPQATLPLAAELAQPRRSIRHRAQATAAFILLTEDKAKPAASAPG
jgi:hypothetical protein